MIRAMLKRKWLLALQAIGVAACISSAAHADTIVMRAAVRLSEGANAIRLADIADLSGPDAETLADLMITDLPVKDGPIELSVREVRAKLEEAGAHWGRINLSGRRVVVRPAPRPTIAAPLAMTPVSLSNDDPHTASHVDPTEMEFTADAIVPQPTLRGEIARALVRELAVEPDRLRMRFDRNDEVHLETALEGLRFELSPNSVWRSDRVTITVRAWRDDRIEWSEIISVRPFVRMTTARLLRDISRDEPISGGDVEPHVQWLPVTQIDDMCDPDSIIGRLAARRMHEGDVLRRQHVRKETLVERGDRLMVRCLVGGVVISMQAEALSDGADGEMIDCRKIGERTTFSAVVSGRGEAVVNLNRNAS